MCNPLGSCTFLSDCKVFILGLSLVGGKDSLVHADISLGDPTDGQLPVLVGNLILGTFLHGTRDIINNPEPGDLGDDSAAGLVYTEHNGTSLVGLTWVHNL